MPQTTISPGATEEIYQGQPGDTLYINTDADIRFSSFEEFARAGRPVRADQTVTARLERRGEKIFVHNDGDGDATVEYHREDLVINLFGRQVVRRPTDQASADKKVSSHSFDFGTVGPGATETNTVTQENLVGTRQFVRTFSWTQRDLEDATMELILKDSDGNETNSERLDRNTKYVRLDPAFPIPVDGSITTEIVNSPGNNIDGVGVNWVYTYE